jgi:hypothetical protein
MIVARRAWLATLRLDVDLLLGLAGLEARVGQGPEARHQTLNGEYRGGELASQANAREHCA